MTYLVLRWSMATSRYTALNIDFEDYGQAEQYAANRHDEAPPNTFRFVPMSRARYAQVIDKQGRRRG